MNKKKMPSILLVSIDAIKIELALAPEKHGIKLPTITKLMEKGAFASQGTKPVFPSLTYCCHQSIITGTHPDTHGIYSNKEFDPNGKHMDAWYWFVSDKVPTLWSYAKQNGYLSVNVGFPTSVLAETDYNIPEYWRDTTELDSKILNAVSYPQGLAKEAEDAVGRIPCGLWDLKDDLTKLNTCIWMLDNKIKRHIDEKPFFMTTYFASYDDLAHNEGTYGEKPLSYLEKTDEYLGILIEKAREITDDNVIICVISDHGMLDNIADIRPNTQFLKEGLITVDDNDNIIDWEVWCQRAGGAGNIKLKDPNNNEVREKVKTILEGLVEDKDSGVVELMTGQEASLKRRGFPDADYVISSKPGYEVREDLHGDFLTFDKTQKAQHGYCEDLQDMKGVFYISGKNIEEGRDLGGLNLIDIAPTLARLMGFDMETAEGNNIL